MTKWDDNQRQDAHTMMWPLWTRATVESLKRFARLVETPPEPRKFGGHRGIDIGWLPILKEKAYPGGRDVRHINLIVVHVTDVRGGFGVQKWGPTGWQHWEREIMAGNIPSHIRELLPADPRAAARIVGQWSRLRNTPYHSICSNGWLLQNRPLRSETWHGNSGNRGFGWAMDCHHRERLTGEEAETGILSLCSLLQRARFAGNKENIRIAPHGCFSGKRLVDTHREVYLRIVYPVVKRVAEGYGLGKVSLYEGPGVDGGRSLRGLERLWKV